MTHFQLTSDAENDLNLIWDFIARDNVDAANRVLEKLEESMEMLAAMPEMAQKRLKLSKIYPNLRAWPVSDYPNYLIFYIPVNNGILVLRVLNGAQNVEKILR